MNKTTTKLRIYLSHPAYKLKEIDTNEVIYKHVGEEIRAYLIDWEKMDGFPKMELYLPAEHEEFIRYAYLLNYLTTEELLNINCKIIEKCHLLILFEYFKLTPEMECEMIHARKHGLPVFNMPSLSNASIQSLQYTINLILKSGIGE